MPRPALRAVLAVITVFGLLGLNAVAFAAGTGSITGTVTAADGASVTGVCVSVHDRAGTSYGSPSSVSADGTYTVSGLAAGSYRVQFRGCAFDSPFATQWYAGAAELQSARAVDVIDGAATGGIDVLMRQTGTVTGVVKDSQGMPISGICVSGGSSSSPSTGTDGRYTAAGLAPGERSLSFGACGYSYFPSPGGSAWASKTTTVTVIEGQSVTLDVELARKGQITGTVTDGAGHPLAGICVDASTSDYFMHSGQLKTDVEGRYTLSGLDDGEYYVRFSDCAASREYATQWWQGAATADLATRASVREGMTTTADAQLALGAKIAGVLRLGGTPVGNACVSAFGTSGDPIDAITGSDGSFAVSALPSGTYSVRFLPNSYCSEYGGGDSFRSQWLGRVQQRPTSTPVAVVAGQTVALGEIDLVQPAVIAGTVTSDMQPVGGACVSANGADGPGFANSDAQGRYRLSLWPGTYTVDVTGCGNQYLPSRHEDRVATEGATSVLDVALVRGGTIEGRVTRTDGTHVSGACVSLYDADGSYAGGSSPHTGSDGTYSVTGLQPGSYAVRVELCSPISYDVSGEWYQDATSFETATKVDVAAGGTTVLDDVVLETFARVSGVVTDDTGAPVGGACVSLEGPGFAWATTADDGSYTVSARTAGNYTVRVAPCSFPGSFREAYFGSGSDGSSATRLALAPGGQRQDVDVQVERTGSLTGKVLSDAGEPLVGACVTARTESIDYMSPSTATNDTGEWTLPGLVKGDYVVSFSDCGRGGFLTEHFDDAVDARDARALTVAPGSAVTVPEVRLTPASSVAGKVLRQHDSAPAAGACVTATDRAGAVLGTTRTNAAGDYRIGGLRSGSYRVNVTGCAQDRLVPVWYAGSTSLVGATPVLLATAEQRSAIDMTVAVRGTLGGTVVDQDGSPVAGICVRSGGDLLATTGVSGVWRSGPLDPRSYVLEFQDCAGSAEYQSEFYDDASDAASAAPVTVQPATHRGGVDAVLAPRVTTTTSAPGAPTGITVSAGDASAVVSWTPPADSGTSPITHYTVTSSPGARTGSAPASDRSVVVTGLTNGTAYTFTVTASNSVGTGPASAPSAAVTPAAPPQEPTTPPQEPTSPPQEPTAPPQEPAAPTEEPAAPSTPPAPVVFGDLPPTGQSRTVSLPAGTAAQPSTAEVGALTLLNSGPAADVRVGTLSSELTRSGDVTVLGPVVDLTPAPTMGTGQLVVCLRPGDAGLPATSPFRAAPALWHVTADGSVVDESARFTGTGVAGSVCGSPSSFSPFFAGSLPVVPRSAEGACVGVLPAGFVDVDVANPHRAAVDCASWWALTRGTTAAAYSPAAPVTRAQMASFLTRLVLRSGGTLPDGPDAFSDDEANVHEPSVNRLAAAGIVRGVGDGRYAPDALVSREQMATFLVRAHEHTTGTPLPLGAQPFTDAAESAHRDAISKAVTAGFAQGRSSTDYAPKDDVRRDQMASFLTRALSAAARR